MKLKKKMWSSADGSPWSETTRGSEGYGCFEVLKYFMIRWNIRAFGQHQIVEVVPHWDLVLWRSTHLSDQLGYNEIKELFTTTPKWNMQMPASVLLNVSIYRLSREEWLSNIVVFVFTLLLVSMVFKCGYPLLNTFFFWGWNADALCLVTKALSAEDNEGNAEGMLSSLERNVSPCPWSQYSIQSGPPTKKHATLKYQVTLCESHSLYHCHMSDFWLIENGQTQTRSCGWGLCVCLKSNESHPLSDLSCVWAHERQS